MSKKPKRGRPPLPKAQVKTVTLHVRVRKSERAKVKAAAKRAGESVSAWARERLVQAADE